MGHVALWKCQNLSLDDKWSRAQHWVVLWNIWLWVSWTWNSYSTVPFPASAHSMYWLSGSRLLTSKQNFTNLAEGSIHLSLAAMDGSSLTCWQLPQTLREPQTMQQDLNSENFLWPSHGIDFRLSIKPIAGGDKFLSLHSYTVSIWAAVSASARSMALLPILPHVGLVTSSQHHLKFPPTSAGGGTDELGVLLQAY